MSAADYQYHNTMFLVAHFHNTIIPGVVFAMLAALTYYWPKMFGFMLNERIGREYVNGCGCVGWCYWSKYS
jgi:cytochrome aa3-600 menaquinol oxidase subunit 1